MQTLRRMLPIQWSDLHRSRIPGYRQRSVCPSVLRKERKERGDALGHVLAVNDYEPGAEYIYYWGSGWSKYGFEADTDWNKYLEEYARKIRNPLAVAIK